KRGAGSTRAQNGGLSLPVARRRRPPRDLAHWLDEAVHHFRPTPEAGADPENRGLEKETSPDKSSIEMPDPSVIRNVRSGRRGTTVVRPSGRVRDAPLYK